VFHGQGNCFVCHGQDLEGTPIAPTLQDHKWKDAKDGSLQEIYRVVTHGVDGTAMVSHPGGITDAQAVSAAIYVYSVSHGKTKP
jgi:mono/diheme cytochrome c family protein